MSNYSYIAFEGLTRHRPLWKTPIAFKPILLGQVMKATGNKPPIFNQTKEKYVMKDFDLNAQYWNLDVRMPTNFKEWISSVSSKVPQRVLAGLEEQDPELMETVARILWKRYLGEHKDIFSIGGLEEALKGKVPGHQAILDLAESENAKKKLISNTNEAIENESFGAPWTCVKDSSGKVIHHMFGSDRIPQIAFTVGEKFYDRLE